MASLRTPKTEQTYKDFIAQGHLDNGCRLCLSTPLNTFTYWKIIPNDFPYDKIAQTHHMLVPLRHVTEDDLTDEEKKELRDLKLSYLNEHYQYALEAMHKNKSIPGHFHIHLIVVKEL